MSVSGLMRKKGMRALLAKVKLGMGSSPFEFWKNESSRVRVFPGSLEFSENISSEFELFFP